MKVNAATAGSMFYVSPGTTPVSVATALAYVSRFPKRKILITDTGENIAKNLDNLQKIANNVTTLVNSDLATPLSITATQLRKNATILGKLGNANYLLHVRDVSAANATADVSAAAAVKAAAEARLSELQASKNAGNANAARLLANLV